jgi:hypothetical protein
VPYKRYNPFKNRPEQGKGIFSRNQLKTALVDYLHYYYRIPSVHIKGLDYRSLVVIVRKEKEKS